MKHLMRFVILAAFAVGMMLGLVLPSEAQRSRFPSPGGTFAAMPTDGTRVKVYTVIDCIDVSCAAGGGSAPWLLKRWDGSAWVNTTAADLLVGSMDLSTGTLRGGVSVETTGIAGTDTAEGQWVFVTPDTTPITRTLPAVATSGQSICYYTTTAAVLTIDPASSEVIVLDGAAQTGGVTLVSSAVVGELVCLLSNGTNWYVLGKVGVWAAGS